MQARLVLPGDRFNRLTILNEEDQIHKKRRFRCQCDCGNVVVVYLTSLTTNNTKSCGCLRSDVNAVKNKVFTQRNQYTKRDTVYWEHFKSQ